MPTVKFKDISRFVGVEDFLFGGSVQGNDIYGHYFREEWEGFHCVHEEGQKGFEDFKDCIKNLLEDYGVDTELQCVERGKDTFNFKMPPEEHLKGYYLRKNRSYGLVCFPKDVGHILDLVRRTHNSSKVFGFRGYSAHCLLNCDFIRIEDGCLWKIRSFNHFERGNVNLYGGHAIRRLETRGIKC